MGFFGRMWFIASMFGTGIFLMSAGFCLIVSGFHKQNETSGEKIEIEPALFLRYIPGFALISLGFVLTGGAIAIIVYKILQLHFNI